MKNIANVDMKEYWNGDGGREWVRFQNRIDEGLIPFGLKAMTVANFLPGERVLDIGCGCGDTSFEIARQVGATGYVQGIDISELVLERARNREATESLGNVNFECSDAQIHDFEKMGFDVIFSRYGVMFFDDPEAAFKNIRRALNSKGRMTFICWKPVKENQWVSLPLDIASNYVQLPEPSDPESPGGFSFGDAARVMRILSAAGFINISIQQFHETFNVGENLDEAVKFLSSIGPASVAMGAPEVDDVTRHRFNSALHDFLGTHLTADGIKLNAATWIVTADNP